MRIACEKFRLIFESLTWFRNVWSTLGNVWSERNRRKQLNGNSRSATIPPAIGKKSTIIILKLITFNTNGVSISKKSLLWLHFSSSSAICVWGHFESFWWWPPSKDDIQLHFLSSLEALAGRNVIRESAAARIVISLYVRLQADASFKVFPSECSKCACDRSNFKYWMGEIKWKTTPGYNQFRFIAVLPSCNIPSTASSAAEIRELHETNLICQILNFKFHLSLAKWNQIAWWDEIKSHSSTLSCLQLFFPV